MISTGHAVTLDDARAAFFYDSTLTITWLRDLSDGSGSANWKVHVSWRAGELPSSAQA